MAYEDVPERLAAGEAVPRSEIIGYWGPDATDLQVSLGCEVLVMASIMFRSYEGEILSYGLTALGLSIREDLITRLEGECPECPE